jgi:CO/xanthine dehydrogenase Mo-binding subunit
VAVAESRYIAEDALDLIAVEYDLPVMVDPEQAVKAPGDGVLHPERGRQLTVPGRSARWDSITRR